MPEHTPTPWYTDDPHIVCASVEGGVNYLANTNDLDTDYETSVANAAFIVKAVNAYDELAQKLQNCIHALTFCIDGWDEADPYIQKLRVTRDGAQKALDALAKVEAA